MWHAPSDYSSCMAIAVSVSWPLIWCTVARSREGTIFKASSLFFWTSVSSEIKNMESLEKSFDTFRCRKGNRSQKTCFHEKMPVKVPVETMLRIKRHCIAFSQLVFSLKLRRKRIFLPAPCARGGEEGRFSSAHDNVSRRGLHVTSSHLKHGSTLVNDLRKVPHLKSSD